MREKDVKTEQDYQEWNAEMIVKHEMPRRKRKLKHGFNMYTSLTPVERVPELMPCNQDKEERLN